MKSSIELDPVTLRALAAELDMSSESYRRDCRCAIHLFIIAKYDQMAADYRTRAIKVELARGAKK